MEKKENKTLEKVKDYEREKKVLKLRKESQL